MLKASDVIRVMKQNNFLEKVFPFIETYRNVRTEKLHVIRTELISGCIAPVRFIYPEQIRKGRGQIKIQDKAI